MSIKGKYYHRYPSEERTLPFVGERLHMEFYVLTVVLRLSLDLLEMVLGNFSSVENRFYSSDVSTVL